MALDDSATLVIGGGHLYTGPAGTAFPTDPNAPGVDFTEIGHTSIDNILQFASDGGETTVLGTLQNKSLRTTTSPRTETWTFILEQWDAAALKLYFGSNATVNSTTGQLEVPTAPEPTESAFLAVYTDGGRTFSIYAPKASLERGDDLSLEDTESLAGLSIKVTPLQYQTNNYLYSVTPLDYTAP